MFNAPVAMQVYTQIFAEEGALDRLEGFASLNGPNFYGLPPNEETHHAARKLHSTSRPRRRSGRRKRRHVFRPDTPVDW